MFNWSNSIHLLFLFSIELMKKSFFHLCFKIPDIAADIILQFSEERLIDIAESHEIPSFVRV
jgi:hypothetical protein